MFSIMHKFFSTLFFTLLIPMGIALAMNAADKKDDKKDNKDKGKEEEKHQPVLVFTWEHAWSPVYRAIPLQDAIDIIDSEYINE